MKKFTKLLAVLVAFIMSLSIFAFAACEDETEDNSVSATTSTGNSESTSTDSSESGSSSEDGSSDSDGDSSSSVLSALVLSTLSDIYTSTTGYEFTVTADCSVTDADNIATGAGIDATILTQNDGENFNADAEVYTYATSAEETSGVTSTYTTYNYASALLRGGDIYTAYTETNENGLTDSEKSELVYDYCGILDYVEYLTSSMDLSSYLDTDVSGEYSGLISVISALGTNLLSGMTGTAEMHLQTSTSSSDTLDFVVTITFDLAEVLLTNVTAIDDMLNTIYSNSESGTEYTLNDFLSDTTVQKTLEQYLDGMTGSDIYDVLNILGGLLADTTVDFSGLPEDTTEQSAYEYLLLLASNYGYGTYVLNSEEVLTYISQALEITSGAKTALEAATIEFAVTYNQSAYSLSSISFDIHNLTISGNEVDLDFDIAMQSKAVTLTDVTEINYNTITINYDSVTVSETTSADYYYVLTKCYDGSNELYLYYYVYEYDAETDDYSYGYSEILEYTVSLTYDESGNVTEATLTDLWDETAEGVTYTATDNAITLKVYDDMVEIVIAF